MDRPHNDSRCFYCDKPAEIRSRSTSGVVPCCIKCHNKLALRHGGQMVNDRPDTLPTAESPASET